MDVRPYQDQDREGCLLLFDSNVPHFFASGEREAFRTFLKSPQCDFLVMHHEGEIAGCGGWVVPPEQHLARLVWGIIRADLQRLGLGRFLLLFRLREIGKLEGIHFVGLRTSQEASPFFAKQGFRMNDAIQASAGLVEMVKKLTVCA